MRQTGHGGQGEAGGRVAGRVLALVAQTHVGARRRSAVVVGRDIDRSNVVGRGHDYATAATAGTARGQVPSIITAGHIQVDIGGRGEQRGGQHRRRSHHKR